MRPDPKLLPQRRVERKHEVAMLPPFIIEQIRKREEEEAREREQQRPALELPIHVPVSPAQTEEEEIERGVIVIDLMG